MTTILLIAALSTVQTTPTEKAAAGRVMQEIDAVQARLQPTRTAEQMVNRADAPRDRILARVEQLWRSDMIKLSDWIGRNPEVGWKEFKAVDTLTKVLKSRGFAVERGSAG